MSWTQIRIDQIPRDSAEEVEENLLSLGAVAVTLNDSEDQPIFEPEIGNTPLWNKIQIVGLFEEQDSAPLMLALEKHPSIVREHIHVEIVEDTQWESAWMDQFHAMKFGNRLWVCPQHDIPKAEPGDIILKLDPGIAFGTGTHPTTHLCLEWLDNSVTHGERVIDYGCGSGILAIAALLLGARHVWATDIDEQALSATEANAAANDVLTNLHTSLPTSPPGFLADTLVANILANPLITLAPHIIGLIKPRGKIGLSGILEEQANEVIQAYSPHIQFQPTKQLDEWVLLSGHRK